jgi:ATP-dependent RNA helicase DeaD
MNDTTQLPAADAAQEENIQAFAALGLGAEALHAISDLGFGAPTPVQLQAIPLVLSGRDVIAQAPTGTGKTAAFGLPIVERLDEAQVPPQALVVVPTRELCIQVAEALHSFGKYRELISLPIYGGQPYERQFRALKRGVHVVVGTPGRLLDHIRRETLDLSSVRFAVLDEADEMLDMGFIEDIEAILGELPEEHQTTLFSATIPPRIASLAERYLHGAARISVAAREAVAPRVRQVYYEVPYQAKYEALSRILDLETPESAIVFVNTRRDAETVAEQLSGLGYVAQAIHGEVTQAQRERVLDRFRAGRTQLLVATDVAARGLDIPEVSHIINYDLPLDAESYVHRIGRTGRAGRAGQALTLVTPRERRQLRLIEQGIRRNLERLRLPTVADVASRRRAAFREDVLAILDAGQLDPYLALVEDLVGSREPAEIAAAAFKMAAQAREATRPGGPASWLEVQSEETTPQLVDQDEPLAQPSEGRPNRRDRRERERLPRRGGAMARMFLRVGRDQGVRPTDIVGAIANEANIPGDSIGEIDIYDAFAFVEVPEEAVDRVLNALNTTTIRGKNPRATLARPSGAWQEDDMRDDGRMRNGSSNREREDRPRSLRGASPKPHRRTTSGYRGDVRRQNFPASKRKR